ncbi:hypothetical protein QZH41_020552, partial [Actinostola sp. cb2023]
MTAEEGLRGKVSLVECGEMIGDLDWLIFRDPNCFLAGELHNHASFWRQLAERHPFAKQLRRGIPCLLYIDDRHTGQLQVSLMSGEYSMLECEEERRKKVAGSALFLVVYYLVRLGYFLGLAKSTLIPSKRVPYLGFLVDSSTVAFHLIPRKKLKLLNLVQEILQGSVVSVKALQRLAGKCVSFFLAFPTARLFIREMNCAISKGQKSSRPVFLKDALHKEIAYWLFLENWDPLPWRDERHYRVSVTTGASGSGWRGQLISPVKKELSDYWNAEELHWDIATKEATAVDRLLSFCL